MQSRKFKSEHFKKAKFIETFRAEFLNLFCFDTIKLTIRR